MDGAFHVERRFGVVSEAVTGGMFLILADADDTALRAAEASLEAVSRISLVVVKNAASGSKVGARCNALIVAADVNAVPPAGIEGLSVSDDGAGLPGGALGIGALAIGGVKY